MVPLQLPECHYFGRHDEDDPPNPLSLPDDWSGDAFEYLPPQYILSAEELDLATRYEQSDISGGYLQSQVAYFRMPKPKEVHKRRRSHLAAIISAAESQELKLPTSFLTLAQNDDYMNRIRHNSIWLRLYPKLVPFPHAREFKLLEIFYEGQGCGFWAILLGPGGTHCMVCYNDSLNTDDSFPDGHAPDISDFSFYRCANSFDEWLAYYFLDCKNSDEIYTSLLKEYPGM